MVSPLARRSAVHYLTATRKCSKRHACRLIGIPRSMMDYVARSSAGEKQLVERIRQLAYQHNRYGYRRIAQLLRREGKTINHKRVQRLWQSEGLILPAKRPRRRHIERAAEPMRKAEYPNEVWSYDIMEDVTEHGRQIRILNIIDEYSRECLAIKVDISINSQAVLETLEWLFLTRGIPQHLRSDNGPEFIAGAVQQWLTEHNCRSLFIKPGSPWENSYIESFNGKMRDECLNQNIWTTLRHIQEELEAWRQEYNNDRPHSSLGECTPTEFARNYWEQHRLVATTT
jgi:putative transposase